MYTIPIAISRGNTKIGRIPSVSLPPGATCTPGLPCEELCYAQKAYRLYPITRAAWNRNLILYYIDPEDYFRQIADYLHKTSKTYFRWHVSGDIPDPQYFLSMERIATEFPMIRFMTYTKKPQYLHPYSKNLNILNSVWLGEEPRPDVPNFITLDKNGDTRDYNFKCAGSCQYCHRCWYAPPGDRIAVKLH